MPPPPKTPASRQARDASAQDRNRAQLSSSIRRSQAANTSSSQFAPTPRFNFASPARKITSQAPTSSSSPLATRGRKFKSQTLQEEIDDDDDDIPVASATQQQNVRQSIEDEQEDEMLLDMVEQQVDLKRRHPTSSPPPVDSRKRAQADPILLSSSPELNDHTIAMSDDDVEELVSPGKPTARGQPTSRAVVDLPPPQTPARVSTAPRFKFTPAAPVETTQDTQQTTGVRQVHLPQFILPSQAELQPTIAMLPLLFSPRRRGDKYLPGGLAETVRNWVLEAGGQMLLKEPQEITVRSVESIGSAGAMVITGDMDVRGTRGGTAGNFLLVGTEEGVRNRVQAGDTISTRPGWSMDLAIGRERAEKTKWQVAWGPI